VREVSHLFLNRGKSFGREKKVKKVRDENRPRGVPKEREARLSFLEWGRADSVPFPPERRGQVAGKPASKKKKEGSENPLEIVEGTEACRRHAQSRGTSKKVV